jgi:hypothetical protein
MYILYIYVVKGYDKNMNKNCSVFSPLMSFPLYHRRIHPYASVLYYYLGFGYILTNFGSSCIFTFWACIGNNLSPNRQYPQYWYKDPSSSSSSSLSSLSTTIAAAEVEAVALASKPLSSEIATTTSIVISSDDSGSGGGDGANDLEKEL